MDVLEQELQLFGYKILLHLLPGGNQQEGYHHRQVDCLLCVSLGWDQVYVVLV